MDGQIVSRQRPVNNLQSRKHTEHWDEYIYSSLLGISQRANRLARWLLCDWSSMEYVPRPLLCNGSLNTFQQQSCFLGGPCRRLIREVNSAQKFRSEFQFRVVFQYKVQDVHWVREKNTRVEAGSNTSTVTLRVVGGDEKGSLESETVKYGLEFQGTRTRERPAGKGQ
jgi:hypothetical protein